MHIDLERGVPHQLLESTLDELLQAAPADGAWTERQAEALDYAFAHRVARALHAGADQQELLELHDAILDTAALARDEDGMADWSLRWRSMARVLDARIQTLASQNWEPLLKYQHVLPILERVRERAEPGLSQQALLEALPELGSAPNLTRVLNLMEANELILRRRHGRENQLYLGRNAPPAQAPEQQPPEHETPDSEGAGGSRPLGLLWEVA